MPSLAWTVDQSQMSKINWMMFTNYWCHYTIQEESNIITSAYQDEINLVFANRSEEDVIYPLTVRKIAEHKNLMPA